MIAFVNIPLGVGGLPSCRSCHPNERVFLRSTDEVGEAVRATAGGWSYGPGPNVAFTGVESFAHPELPTLVRSAVGAGIERIRLTTGGEPLGAGDNAIGSVDAGVRQIEFVVLAGEPGVHDELCGGGHSLARALQGVARFRDAGRDRGVPVAVVARIPVCDHNLDAVPSAVAAVGAAGALSVEVDLAGLSTRAAEPTWFAAVADTGVVSRVWVSFRGADGTPSIDPLHDRSPWHWAGDRA